MARWPPDSNAINPVKVPPQRSSETNGVVNAALALPFLQPYNHKSDVWSFGCCCYEMATQKQAFNARDINALVYRVVRGKVARLPALYSDTLNDIVQSMLATDTDNRPTVDALLQMKYVQRHIERFLGNQAKSAEPPPPLLQPRRPIPSFPGVH